MSGPVVFRAGSYLVPFGLAMLIGAWVLYPQVGLSTLAIYGLIFYFLLVFSNSLERGIREFGRRRRR